MVARLGGGELVAVAMPPGGGGGGNAFPVFSNTQLGPAHGLHPRFVVAENLGQRGEGEEGGIEGGGGKGGVTTPLLLRCKAVLIHPWGGGSILPDQGGGPPMPHIHPCHHDHRHGLPKP